MQDVVSRGKRTPNDANCLDSKNCSQLYVACQSMIVVDGGNKRLRASACLRKSSWKSDEPAVVPCCAAVTRPADDEEHSTFRPSKQSQLGSWCEACHAIRKVHDVQVKLRNATRPAD